MGRRLGRDSHTLEVMVLLAEQPHPWEHNRRTARGSKPSANASFGEVVLLGGQKSHEIFFYANMS